jgi:hypothetical protein
MQGRSTAAFAALVAILLPLALADLWLYQLDLNEQHKAVTEWLQDVWQGIEHQTFLQGTLQLLSPSTCEISSPQEYNTDWTPDSYCQTRAFCTIRSVPWALENGPDPLLNGWCTQNWRATTLDAVPWTFTINHGEQRMDLKPIMLWRPCNGALS